MAQMENFHDRISARYSQLSKTLQIAADFIIANPPDVASRSLRSIANAAGMSPASLTRLAKSLGYQTYEELREDIRGTVSDKFEPFSDRAKRMRAAHENTSDNTIFEQSETIRSNIDCLYADLSENELNHVSNTLLKARKVHLIGALGSAGLLDQFAYMASWFSQNWSVTGKDGNSLAAALANLTEDDVVFVLSMAPFAKRSILATQFAMERNAKVIVVTDSHKFPGLQYADAHFLVRSESSNFFSSYTAVMALFETMIGRMVELGGQEADLAISKVEETNKKLEQF